MCIVDFFCCKESCNFGLIIPPVRNPIYVTLFDEESYILLIYLFGDILIVVLITKYNLL